MPGLTTNGWLLLATIGASGILAMYHVLAAALGNEWNIRAHAEECRRLRQAYFEMSRARAACESEDSDVSIVRPG